MIVKEELLILMGMSLAFMRETMAYTQVDISNETGITQNHISKIESGKKEVSIYTLKKICDALEISMGELLMGIEE